MVLKLPKQELKLVSALSETRRLFWLFRFHIDTASFGVSKQPKQPKINQNKPKNTERKPKRQKNGKNNF
jgi:hypothetical protein